MIIAKIALLLLASTTLLIGKDIYISSSMGDNSNDGSLSKPLKTISSMPKENANIFLKRGDVFFESIADIKNINIDTYSTGAKPMLCGITLLKDSNNWVRLPNNLWRTDLQDNENFIGFKYDETQSDIGAIFDVKNDKIYAHKVDSLDKLNAEFDFCVTNKYLYFKSEKKPSEFIKTVGFIVNQKAISNLNNASIRNLTIKGFGSDAVSNLKNSTIENIDIDTIRGCAFKINDSNNSISNCKITRTFGSAFSIENKNDTNLSNIKIANNSLFRCRQALNISKNGNAKFNEIIYKNNKSFDIGETEFNSPNVNDCNLYLKNITAADNILIENNIFWGSSLISSNTNTFKLAANKFYIYKTQYLYFNEDNIDMTIWADAKNSLEKFNTLFANQQNLISIISKDDKDLKDEILDESFSEQKEKIIQKTQEKYRRDSFYRK